MLNNLLYLYFSNELGWTSVQSTLQLFSFRKMNVSGVSWCISSNFWARPNPLPMLPPSTWTIFAPKQDPLCQPSNGAKFPGIKLHDYSYDMQWVHNSIVKSKGNKRSWLRVSSFLLLKVDIVVPGLQPFCPTRLWKYLLFILVVGLSPIWHPQIHSFKGSDLVDTVGQFVEAIPAKQMVSFRGTKYLNWRVKVVRLVNLTISLPKLLWISHYLQCRLHFMRNTLE